ncbi:MAG: alkaline phosphatase [Clostridia bacterium]|nr:alkaline phosphatase [Clostridia bacterium]
MKKTMSIILIAVILVMQLCAFPVNVSGATADSIILAGTALSNATSIKNVASKSVETDAQGRTYVKFVPTTGTKPEISITQGASGVNLAEYPYWVVSYYQSQTATRLDTTFKADLTSINTVYPDAGLTNSFYCSGQDQPAASNGEWKTVVLKRDGFYADSADYPPTSAMTGQYLRFKPWSSNAKDGSYFALEYVGFFKSEQAAEDYINSLNLEDSKVVSGQALFAAASLLKNATSSLVNDTVSGKTYVKFAAVSGTKPEISITQKDSGVNLAAYPYWVVSYYQSQNASKLDATFKADLQSVQAAYPNEQDITNSFYSNPHPEGSNGEWKTTILVRDNFYGTEGCPPVSSMTGQYLRFKPWTSNATDGSYFAIDYVAFFKSESAAKEYIESLNKPEEDEGDITVVADGNAEYTIIYDDDISDIITPELANLANAMRYDLGVGNIPTASDTSDAAADPVAKEIVIGNTNRSGALSQGLVAGEYIVKYDKSSKRIFIVGGTAEDTVTALWYFYNTYVDAENKTVIIPSTLNYEMRVDHIILSGEELFEISQTSATSNVRTVYDFAQKKIYARFDAIEGENPEINITQSVSGINMAKYPYWVASYFQSQNANNLDTSFYADKASVQGVYGSDITAYSFFMGTKPAASKGEWKSAVIKRDDFILTGSSNYTPTEAMTGQKLRFKPWQYTGGANAGSYFLLEYVAFFEKEADAAAFAQKNWSNVAVESLKVTSKGNEVSSITVMEGSELDLSVNVSPYGSFENVSVSSDNPEIVDIVNGRIKAIDGGNARLTIKANAGLSTAPVITRTVDVTVASYRFDNIAIDGVDIGNYKIVIPENCSLYSKYAAELLADYISSNLNCIPEIVSDKTAESDYEILVGNTNRSESSTGIRLGANEYVLVKNGNKVVMSENGLYTAQSVAAFTQEYIESNEGGSINITTLPKTASKKTFAGFAEKAENVIIMIGDGMGYNHINMALANGLDKFVAQDFPVAERQITRHQGVIDNVLKGKTDPGYTDSAASATALSTGYKTYTAKVGKDKDGNDVKHVSELAYENGAELAVVTNDAITGATPASFFVHNDNRTNYDEIQADIDALVVSGALDYCAGSVGNGLTEHTKKALKKISENGSRFFAMIEDGGMDSHGGLDAVNANYALSIVSNVKRFNDAIAYASQFVILHPDTALIVTADHETGGITADNSELSFGVGYRFTTKVHTNRNVPLYAFGAGVDALAGGPIENIDVARFMAKVYGANSFGQSEEIPVMRAGDVDADGVIGSTDSVILSRYLANWTGYDVSVWAEYCNMDGDSTITSGDSVILARHLASWSGYETLPLVG